jgi:hypothetical protein
LHQLRQLPTALADDRRPGRNVLGQDAADHQVGAPGVVAHSKPGKVGEAQPEGVAADLPAQTQALGDDGSLRRSEH